MRYLIMLSMKLKWGLVCCRYGKAFDSLEHSFIFATLTRFDFGNDFIQWIRTLLCHGSSCVTNTDQSTGYFNFERGARQGDPNTSLFCV